MLFVRWSSAIPKVQKEECASDRITAKTCQVRRRKFGEYSMELVVVEWPLHPSEATIHSLKATIRSVLTEAVKEERQVDGIPLVADHSHLLGIPIFTRFTEAFQDLGSLGHHPRAIVQRCEHCSKIGGLPFFAEYWPDQFLTRLNLHQLLAKQVEQSQQ